MLLVGAWAPGPSPAPWAGSLPTAQFFPCQQPCSPARGAAQESPPARALLPLPPPGPPVVAVGGSRSVPGDSGRSVWEFPRPTCSRTPACDSRSGHCRGWRCRWLRHDRAAGPRVGRMPREVPPLMHPESTPPAGARAAAQKGQVWARGTRQNLPSWLAT